MEDITPQELKQRMANKEPLNIIDVREPREYERFRITDKNIPLFTLPTSLDKIMHLKNKEIILHCRSGIRSRVAKEFLQEQGFTKVRKLIEGLEGYLHA
ncbi:MAG: rhodanese-like domain-containing protein [Cytophagales bacterium]|nr:rhodanese-like domain-containing protein [Cytophagales bacterium]